MSPNQSGAPLKFVEPFWHVPLHRNQVEPRRDKHAAYLIRIPSSFGLVRSSATPTFVLGWKWLEKSPIHVFRHDE
jgi:hypothetical protein